jgi:hypothetical protein
MLIAACPPDLSCCAASTSARISTSVLYGLPVLLIGRSTSQPSSGLWFGGSAASVELVPRSLCRLHYTRPRASPARSLLAAPPARSNCLSKHRAAGIIARSAPHGRSERGRASRQHSPLTEARHVRCASSRRVCWRRQHVAAACSTSTSPRIPRVATPSSPASTAIATAAAATAPASAAALAAGPAVAIHSRGVALAAPGGALPPESRGRR